MKNNYQIIVCDFPWAFSDKLQMSDIKRGSNANYSTLTIEQIKSLPIDKLADPEGAILAIWCPSSLIKEGLDIMDKYNFHFKQTYIWVKIKKKKNLFIDFNKWIKKQTLFDYKIIIENIIKTDINNILSFGLGRLFRQTHEVCLIGINNNKIYKQLNNKSQRSVSFDENLKHSTKPEHLQNSLEIMFPGAKKIELFARRIKPGWTCLGNEVCNGEDIFYSIAKLIK